MSSTLAIFVVADGGPREVEEASPPRRLHFRHSRHRAAAVAAAALVLVGDVVVLEEEVSAQSSGAQ